MEILYKISTMIYDKKLKEYIIDMYYKDYFISIILKLDFFEFDWMLLFKILNIN